MQEKKHFVHHLALLLTLIMATASHATESVEFSISARVLFDYKSATPVKKGFDALDEVMSQISDDMKLTLIRISGHTDDQGAELANLILSRERANFVYEYISGSLKQAAVAPKVVGFGEMDPTVSNNSEIGRSMNRRVDIELRGKKPLP